jgi:hypothetical protein
MTTDHTALVVLIGAPRSGTTWLQNLLAADDRVASPQETSLFSRYVAPLAESWRWSMRGTPAEWAQRRYIGLPAALSTDEFSSLVSAFVEGVLASIVALKPGASVVVEKTPSHSLHVEAVAQYAPQARFVHILRDGRDVAASLVSAGDGWGRAWGAPRSIADAAAIWVEYVTHARAAGDLGPYCEVRYEDLRGERGAAELARVLDFCGLASDEDATARRIDTMSLASRQGGAASALVFGGEAARYADAGVEPEGFFGSGSGGGWQTWSTAERVAFDAVGGALLRELGYVSDDAWVGDARAVRRARRARTGRGSLARVARGIGRRLQRAGDRIERPG